MAASYLRAGASATGAPHYTLISMLIKTLFSLAALAAAFTVPPAAAQDPRVFELRTYESPTNQDHWRKIEQMSSGEADIFTKAGIPQVFYGDTLVGPRLPNITYMICFNSLAERDGKWDAFRSSAEWKALSGNPRYAFEDIVSNITNIMLAPTAYSQV